MNKKSEQLFNALHNALSDTTHIILINHEEEDSFTTAGSGNPLEVAKLLAQGLVDLMNRHEAWRKPMAVLAAVIMSTLSNNGRNNEADDTMDISSIRCSSTIH